jgi:hypothetical protein
MIFVGIILLIGAVACYFIARNSKAELDAMNAADTFDAQTLQELHGKVSTLLGTDVPIAEKCEIEGTIECDQPLKAPLSGTACVAYVRTTVREYEEQVTTKDAEGKTVTSMQRGSETMETDQRQVNFWVRDQTGRTLVCPENGEIDYVDSADRFEQGERAGGGKSSGLGGGVAQRKTLGYRHTEKLLPMGINVYILGCATSSDGQPMVGCNTRKSGETFMISRKSERELASSAASSARNFMYAAYGCGALGAILVIADLIM